MTWFTHLVLWWLHMHPHVMYCSSRDWGSDAQFHGKWYMCNPYHHHYIWQLIPARWIAS